MSSGGGGACGVAVAVGKKVVAHLLVAWCRGGDDGDGVACRRGGSWWCAPAVAAGSLAEDGRRRPENLAEKREVPETYGERSVCLGLVSIMRKP
ncbi:hypothetical protein Tco_1264976 [Tanacetum coccineum]